MSGERRVALMFEMSEEAREIVHMERSRRLGAELADAAWPRR